MTTAEDFRTLTQTYFGHAETAPDEVTDVEAERATRLVERLRRDGIAVQTLSPLLADEEPAVRGGAAIFLIQDGVQRITGPDGQTVARVGQSISADGIGQQRPSRGCGRGRPRILLEGSSIEVTRSR